MIIADNTDTAASELRQLILYKNTHGWLCSGRGRIHYRSVTWDKSVPVRLLYAQLPLLHPASSSSPAERLGNSPFEHLQIVPQAPLLE
jgi:hypothetical protein